MDKYRMRFQKTGRSIYISHLDLMHTMQRAFSRAGFRIRYSEGFNPHPILSIILPLSVGTASLCEIMDFRMTEDPDPSEIVEKLNRTLPEGITVLEAYEPQRKASELKYLAIEGRMEYDNASIQEMTEALQSFYSAESIIISKKSKRGYSDFDVIRGIREIHFTAGESFVEVKAVISAQEPTFNPDLLSEALQQKRPALQPDFAAFTRLETYDCEMQLFR
ncbi:MAG: DUF2344 domain-containing protein [Oscillospiraceae bacterium]|nr:DUF2344 domain-containing protein [Oscillospiraceae bacterium]